jgi:hypothetical protein
MAKRSSILRRTVWYRRYKQLAESLDGKGTAETLRAIHRLLNGCWQYGSMTTAAAAHDSVELIIEELHLNGAKSTLEGRLTNITASAYGKTISVADLLKQAYVSDEDLGELFSSIYEGLLQEGILE